MPNFCGRGLADPWRHVPPLRVILNEAAAGNVQPLVKPAPVLLLGLTSLVAAIPPHSNPGSEQPKQPKPSTVEWREAHQALDNLTAWANQVRTTSGQSESGAWHAAGNLWTEVDRLKREGVNVRAIEYYTADLERSLRRGYENTTARRHIQDNLEYEIEAVRRQMRR